MNCSSTYRSVSCICLYIEIYMHFFMIQTCICLYFMKYMHIFWVFASIYRHVWTYQGVHICLYLPVLPEIYAHFFKSVTVFACIHKNMCTVSWIVHPHTDQYPVFACMITGVRAAHAFAVRRAGSACAGRLLISFRSCWTCSAARHDSSSRRQQACSVARWSLNRCLGTVGWKWFTS